MSELKTKKQIRGANGYISLEVPVVAGILNVTPDSFSDGGRWNDPAAALAQAQKMIGEGAAIIDIGGYSTRPGAENISETEELSRVIPVIQAVRDAYPDITLSIDTFRPDVAYRSLEAGAHWINDISGGTYHPEIWDVAAGKNAPYILMHIEGRPETMQENPVYTDVVEEVAFYFSEKLALLHRKGITDIVLDPGFGFGKTTAHNYSLLKNAEVFRVFGKPLMAGVSRKSMISKVLGVKTADTINGTTVLHTLALNKGFSILRAHDVKEAMEAVKIWECFEETGSSEQEAGGRDE